MRYFLTAVFCGLLAATAQAQTTSTAKSDPAQQVAWRYMCQDATATVPKRCRIVQNLTLKQGDAQQRLLTVIIREQPRQKSIGLLLALPHGLFHPAGVQLKVDDNKPGALPIQTSDAKGAYTGTTLTPEMIAAFKKGGQLTVTFQSLQRKNINVPVTLKGFTAAFSKLSVPK